MRTLYGKPVDPVSLVPLGRVMTVKNVAGEELVIRGEMIEGRIRFTHLGGEGGNVSLGAWVSEKKRRISWKRESRSSDVVMIRARNALPRYDVVVPVEQESLLERVRMSLKTKLGDIK